LNLDECKYKNGCVFKNVVYADDGIQGNSKWVKLFITLSDYDFQSPLDMLLAGDF